MIHFDYVLRWVEIYASMKFIPFRICFLYLSSIANGFFCGLVLVIWNTGVSIYQMNI